MYLFKRYVLHVPFINEYNLYLHILLTQTVITVIMYMCTCVC